MKPTDAELQQKAREIVDAVAYIRQIPIGRDTAGCFIRMILAALRSVSEQAGKERDACIQAAWLAAQEPQHVGLILGKIGEPLKLLVERAEQARQAAARECIKALADTGDDYYSPSDEGIAKGKIRRKFNLNEGGDASNDTERA
jgi:hypothetical protein